MSISEESRLQFDEECGVFTWNGQAAPGLDGSQDVMARLSKAIDALQKIAAIKNKDFGSDWEEIEEARQIAAAFLKEVSE